MLAFSFDRVRKRWTFKNRFKCTTITCWYNFFKYYFKNCYELIKKKYVIYSPFFHRFPYPTDDRPTPEVIINVNNPTGVAIDPIDDHLYWAVKSNKIYRSNLDGTDSTIIVNDVYFPLDIDLDISNR